MGIVVPRHFYLLCEEKQDYVGYCSLAEAIEHAEKQDGATHVIDSTTGNAVCVVGVDEDPDPITSYYEDKARGPVPVVGSCGFGGCTCGGRK